ncbi:MAG: hypothetical protein ACYTAS_15325, partial [Planctomycetota bacterium]
MTIGEGDGGLRGEVGDAQSVVDGLDEVFQTGGLGRADGHGRAEMGGEVRRVETGGEIGFVEDDEN